MPLDQLLLLPKAVQEEKQLALEGGPGAVLVEIVQERVLDLFENPARVEALRQKIDEARLADADGAFDSDEIEIHPPLTEMSGAL